MTVLAIILGVLLGIPLLLLLLAALLGAFPVKVQLDFHEEFALTLRYLWFCLPILPEKETPEEEAGEVPSEEKPEEKPKKEGNIGERLKAALKREGLGGFLQTLFELIRLAKEAAAGILRGFRLRRFDLYICLPGAGNAAAGAQLYGQVAGGVYAACGGLFCLMPCREKGVTVDLDYDRREAKVDFSAELSIRPDRVLWEGLILCIKSIRPLKRLLLPRRKRPVPQKSAVK